eukprot:1874872-Prymnesium_polylepis.1
MCPVYRRRACLRAPCGTKSCAPPSFSPCVAASIAVIAHHRCSTVGNPQAFSSIQAERAYSSTFSAGPITPKMAQVAPFSISKKSCDFRLPN